MNITKAQLQELNELLEDTIEYYCDQNMLSGELAWTVTECFATAKVAEINGLVTA